jgi:hypothetical protein
MKLNAVVTIALMAATLGCGDQQLKASADHAGYTLTVTNEDSQDWTNVRAVLNDKYRCPSTDIKAGAPARIRMTTCTTAEGAAFDPQAEGAAKVLVTATRGGSDHSTVVKFE